MDYLHFHNWIMERAPMLAKLYQNKYIAMLYDRFASLPPKQQRQVLLTTGLGVVVAISATLGSSYWSLWSTNTHIKNNTEMISTLFRYQKQRRERGAQIQELERNKELRSEEHTSELQS